MGLGQLQREFLLLEIIAGQFVGMAKHLLQVPDICPAGSRPRTDSELTDTPYTQVEANEMVGCV